MEELMLYTSLEQTQIIPIMLAEMFGQDKITPKEDCLEIMISDNHVIYFQVYDKEKDENTFYSKLNPIFNYYNELTRENVFYNKQDPIFRMNTLSIDENEQQKKDILLQLATTNIIIKLTSNNELLEENFHTAINMANMLSAIISLENGTILNKMGEAILYPDGKIGKVKFKPSLSEKGIFGEKYESKEGAKRKKLTMKKLKKLKIPVLKRLPELPSSKVVKLRTKTEIAQRAITLLIFIQYACDVANEKDLKESRGFIIEALERYDCLNYLTEEEKKFLYLDNPDKERAIHFSWQYEAYWVLIWALGFVPELTFPKEICDCEFAINVLMKYQNYHQFYEAIQMRSVSEILDEADLIYRYDWACVNARVSGESAPASLDEEIVVERHKAFNWLISYQDDDWDNVRADT